MTLVPPIRVGFTEAHGMAVEASQFPPPGVEYSFLKAQRAASRLVRSPIKGYYQRYDSPAHDVIEAVLSPIATKNRWVYSCENLQAAAAFNILGVPLPRSIRVAYIANLLTQDNCRKIVFWSQAGRDTLQTYAGIEDEALLKKTTVVYPAVRRAPDQSVRFHEADDIRLLFTGDFFRKGGVNVVDAFERAQQRYPAIRLIVCCDETIDFRTPNAALRSTYLDKLTRNPGIEMLGRIRRDDLVNIILPRTDVYLLPTYAETFGMSVLEAMAFGIPVIATNHFAIPEMLEHDVSGLLIDTSGFDTERLFRGYVVDQIPDDFRQQVTDQLFAYLCRLIESVEERRRFGLAGLHVARTRFSFETRNRKMLDVYKRATA